MPSHRKGQAAAPKQALCVHMGKENGKPASLELLLGFEERGVLHFLQFIPGAAACAEQGKARGSCSAIVFFQITLK